MRNGDTDGISSSRFLQTDSNYDNGSFPGIDIAAMKKERLQGEMYL